jgi:hypothetical protein
VIGELNMAFATGRAVVHIDEFRAAASALAPKKTLARPSTSNKKMTLKSTSPAGITQARRRRDIGAAIIRATSVTEGQKSRQLLL